MLTLGAVPLIDHRANGHGFAVMNCDLVLLVLEISGRRAVV